MKHLAFLCSTRRPVRVRGRPRLPHTRRARTRRPTPATPRPSPPWRPTARTVRRRHSPPPDTPRRCGGRSFTRRARPSRRPSPAAKPDACASPRKADRSARKLQRAGGRDTISERRREDIGLASTSRSRGVRRVRRVANPGPFSLFNASVSVSYTFDIFGGNRRALEAAMAQVDYEGVPVRRGPPVDRRKRRVDAPCGAHRFRSRLR